MQSKHELTVVEGEVVVEDAVVVVEDGRGSIELQLSSVQLEIHLYMFEYKSNRVTAGYDSFPVEPIK